MLRLLSLAMVIFVLVWPECYFSSFFFGNEVRCKRHSFNYTLWPLQVFGDCSLRSTEIVDDGCVVWRQAYCPRVPRKCEPMVVCHYLLSDENYVPRTQRTVLGIPSSLVALLLHWWVKANYLCPHPEPLHYRLTSVTTHPVESVLPTI